MKIQTRAARRIQFISLAMSILAVCATGAAWAFPDPGVNVQVTFGTVGSQTAPITINGKSETVYMGPYGLYLQSGNPVTSLTSLTPTPMMCFDAAANVSFGQTWTGLAENTAGALDLFKGNVVTQEKIQMIAWLTTQWDGTSPNAQNTNVNLAMWEIMADYGAAGLDTLNVTPGNGNFSVPGGSGSVETLLTLAYDHAVTDKEIVNANFLFPLICNGTACVLDTTTTRPQPFVQAVPEPGTLLLLGSGLVGLGLHGWRKRSKAQK